MMRVRPLRDAMSLREAMDHLLEESVVRPRGTWDGESPNRSIKVPLDIYSTTEEIVLITSLPGLSPDEVDVSIEGDTLTIRGEFQAPLDNVDYMFQERAYGPFARSLTLNVPVDVDKVEAVFEDGVLTLTLPKVEEAKPKTIKVTAK